jgi:hypothetical protein
MGFKVSINKSGLDAFKKKMKAVSGEQRIPLNELMSDSFMQKHTKFTNLQAMLDAGGVDSAEDLTSEEWNSFIAQNTPYKDWTDMQRQAYTTWVKKKLK